MSSRKRSALAQNRSLLEILLSSTCTKSRFFLQKITRKKNFFWFLIQVFCKYIKTDFFNIVFIIEIIVPTVMLWFPVGICKDVFEDSNNGERGVRYLPISLYHTHYSIHMRPLTDRSWIRKRDTARTVR